ncbi:MAG TPA: CBS domain-containing protein [Polyangia bacterium]
MKCSEIMSKNLEVLSDRDTVEQAAALMAEAQIGFVPVCDANHQAVGTVTDRDLVARAMAKHLDPKLTSVSAVMTAPALTCFVDADLRVAEDLMQEEGTEHLVLTGADGTVAGVLGIAEILENAPTREAVRTLKSVLWREALGPRGGAARGAPLLGDEPIRPRIAGEDLPHTRNSVFAMGRRQTDTREFPL